MPPFTKRVEKGWKTKNAVLGAIFCLVKKGGKRVVPLFFPLLLSLNSVLSRVGKRVESSFPPNTLRMRVRERIIQK